MNGSDLTGLNAGAITSMLDQAKNQGKAHTLTRSMRISESIS